MSLTLLFLSFHLFEPLIFFAIVARRGGWWRQHIATTVGHLLSLNSARSSISKLATELDFLRTKYMYIKGRKR